MAPVKSWADLKAHKAQEAQAPQAREGGEYLETMAKDQGGMALRGQHPWALGSKSPDPPCPGQGQGRGQ